MVAEAAVLDRLLGPEGAGLEQALSTLSPAERGQARTLTSLRRRWAPELVALGLRLREAKDRQDRKFPADEPLRFTPELLEQASAHPPAAHRAARLAVPGSVLDLGCGAGGDLTRLAAAGAPVIGLEAEPLAAGLARANLAALNLPGRVETGRFPAAPLPAHAALFLDPARRETGSRGRRRVRPADFSPAPAAIAGLLRAADAWALKWGPALDLRHEALVAAIGPLAGLSRSDYELELVSWNGELREALIWGGGTRSGRPVQATVLRGPPASFETAQYHGDPEVPAPAAAPPEGWIHEPDPALIRAGLVNALAGQLGLRPVAPDIAYLSGPEAVASPFLRSWRLLEDLPFGLSRLQAALSALDAGPLVLKKRGWPEDPELLRRRLKIGGKRSLTILIYRQGSGHRVSIAEGPAEGASA